MLFFFFVLKPAESPICTEDRMFVVAEAFLCTDIQPFYTLKLYGQVL